jgi:hypothetical protein
MDGDTPAGLSSCLVVDRAGGTSLRAANADALAAAVFLDDDPPMGGHLVGPLAGGLLPMQVC